MGQLATKRACKARGALTADKDNRKRDP